MYLLKFHLQSFQQSIYFHHSAINVNWSKVTNYVNEPANSYAGEDCLILSKRKYFIPSWWVSKSKTSLSLRGVEQWVQIAKRLSFECCIHYRASLVIITLIFFHCVCHWVLNMGYYTFYEHSTLQLHA